MKMPSSPSLLDAAWIGKTSLVLKAYEDIPILYFFVSRKSENLLCEEFRQEVETKLSIKTGGS